MDFISIILQGGLIWVYWDFVTDRAVQELETTPGDALHIVWVRGRATGKGIDFQNICIRNGIDFHNFGIRNGTNFRDLEKNIRSGMSGMLFRKIGIKSDLLSRSIGLRNEYVFEASTARPRSKCGQVHPQCL